MKKTYLIVKSITDKILSIIAIILLFIPSIIIAILIKISSKGKIIYKHKRMGKNNKTIYVYKFRTMVENAEQLKDNFTEEQKKEYKENYRLKQDPRITKLGKILRSLCIDEIPQFINVLKGELSIVGPRPITKEELNKYEKNEKEILLNTKPGITGYWQINRQENTTYKERIEMELYYAKNKNILLDIKIMADTIKLIFKKCFNMPKKTKKISNQ